MLERKHLMHYLDSKFDPTGAAAEYTRLGEHMPDLTVSMNPNVTETRNIWGENKAILDGYNHSASISPLYFAYDDSLSEKLKEIAMHELTGDAVKTTVVDVWVKPGATVDDPPTVVEAWRRDVIVSVQSYGGDTSGVQIPFNILGASNRVKGTFELDTKKFTPGTSL